MNIKIKSFIRDFLSAVVVKHNFELKREILNPESYLAEYQSEYFIIKIEKYYREFYTTVSSKSDKEIEINLFNLLKFLHKNNSTYPESNYFSNEKSIEESYKKQIQNIAKVIEDNIDIINEFFKSNYDQNIIDLKKYWRNSYPEFYDTE